MPAKKTTPIESPEAAAPVQPVASATPDAAPTLSVPPQQIGPGDERTWGILAHLSVLLNLITGGFGPIAALIIY